MRRAVVPLSLVCLVGLVAGCTTFPEVDAVEGPDVEQAAYPALVPLGTLIAPEGTEPAEPPRIDDDLEAELTGRAERLQARAAALAGRPVVTDESRTRMQAGTDASAARP